MNTRFWEAFDKQIWAEDLIRDWLGFSRRGLRWDVEKSTQAEFEPADETLDLNSRFQTRKIVMIFWRNCDEIFQSSRNLGD